MSKAVEDGAHSSKEGEDQKLEKGKEHAKVCHISLQIQCKLDCPSCSLASFPGLNHLLVCFVPKRKTTAKILG